jgi:hypothetical protein
MTATPPSERLGIKGEVAALGIDLAVSSRLFLLEQEVNERQARLIAYEVAKLWSGTTDGDTIDNELLRGDPYADENTQIM